MHSNLTWVFGISADVSRSSSTALDDPQSTYDLNSRIHSSDSQGQAGSVSQHSGLTVTAPDDLRQEPPESPSHLDSLRERMSRINAAAVSAELPQAAVPIMPAATERTNTSHMTGTMEALQQRMSLLRKKQEQL